MPGTKYPAITCYLAIRFQLLALTDNDNGFLPPHTLVRSTDRSLANPPLLEPSISLDTPEIYRRGSLELVLRLSSELCVSSRIRKLSRAII